MILLIAANKTNNNLREKTNEDEKLKLKRIKKYDMMIIKSKKEIIICIALNVSFFVLSMKTFYVFQNFYMKEIKRKKNRDNENRKKKYK